MKRTLTCLALLPVLALLLSLSACGSNIFSFLSVRLRAEESTVFAVARNEFALDSAVIPVTLTLYRSDTETADISQMTEIGRTHSDDLDWNQTLELSAPIERDGWYCAAIEYTAGGETRVLLSGTVHYDTGGNRI